MQWGNWSLPFNQKFNLFLQAYLPRLCAVFFCVYTKFLSFENVKFNMSLSKKPFYQVCRDAYERGKQLPSPAKKFQFSVVRWWGNQCLVAYYCGKLETLNFFRNSCYIFEIKLRLET
jgi:hypothetical protein